MVNWCFGLLVPWIPIGSPKMKEIGIRIGVPRFESQTTNLPLVDPSSRICPQKGHEKVFQKFHDFFCAMFCQFQGVKSVFLIMSKFQNLPFDNLSPGCFFPFQVQPAMWEDPSMRKAWEKLHTEKKKKTCPFK